VALLAVFVVVRVVPHDGAAAPYDDWLSAVSGDWYHAELFLLILRLELNLETP